MKNINKMQYPEEKQKYDTVSVYQMFQNNG